MIWVVLIGVVALGLGVIVIEKRVHSLEWATVEIFAKLEAYSSPEYHELQRRIAWDRQQLHDLVLQARKTGDLDMANKMMELQRWADCDYESHWLDGMFRGMP